MTCTTIVGDAACRQCMHACQMNALFLKTSSAPHLIRQVIHGEVQLIAHAASRLPRAHHELVVLALAEATLIPVILLIAPMELHELPCLLVYVGLFSHQLLHERMPQVITVLLQNLYLRPVQNNVQKR